jgi:hypothetical protein
VRRAVSSLRKTRVLSSSQVGVYAGRFLKEDLPVLVGERGPELIVPKSSSNVIPYEKLRKAMANKQGVRQTKGPAMQFGLAA